MMIHDNKLYVEAIKHGTVIDHIPVKVGFKLISLLNFYKINQYVIIGFNLPSDEMGYKDLIKIKNIFLTKKQVNFLALHAPQATINYIDEYKVIFKSRLHLPEYIDSMLICPNIHCISQTELVSSNFIVKKKDIDKILLECKYCEKEFSYYEIIKN